MRIDCNVYVMFLFHSIFGPLLDASAQHYIIMTTYVYLSNMGAVDMVVNVLHFHKHATTPETLVILFTAKQTVTVLCVVTVSSFTACYQ